MKKIVFQNEKEFNAWRNEVIAYNNQHGYSHNFIIEAPKEYPAMAVYTIDFYTVDAHFAPASEYSIIMVYPSDFKAKTLDDLLPKYMVKPEEFDNLAGMILTPKRSDELDENIRHVKFEEAMRDAEYVGIENFRKAKMAGQNPTKWRIKIDGNFDESDVKYAVNRYRDAGWKQVSYSYSDKCPGSREPMGQWIITINVKAGK